MYSSFFQREYYKLIIWEYIILEDYLPEFKRIFQGDIKILIGNHSVHKSMDRLLFCKEHKIKVIDFPPYLPDLNETETIWENKKRR